MVVETSTTVERRGQWLGFIIMLVALAIGAWLIHEGHSGYGVALVFGTLAGIGGTFVYSRRQQQRETQGAASGVGTRRLKRRRGLTVPLGGPRDRPITRQSGATAGRSPRHAKLGRFTKVTCYLINALEDGRVRFRLLANVTSRAD
jgi:hypothetical protein